MRDKAGLLDNRVVLVTGGAGLIGRAFCQAIADAGGTAVVADINGEAAARVADGITAGGGRAEAVALDITSRDSLLAAITEVEAKTGPIHGLVNNAYPRNRNYGRRLEQVEYQDFCENLSVHIGGYFLCSQVFAGHFAAAGGGVIVNMASIYGVMAPRFEVYDNTPMTMPVEYAAIKSGVIHLTRYFAKYYLKQGVRVNCISPGGVEDGQPADFLNAYRRFTGNKGMLGTGDLTGGLLFLLSDMGAAMTGQNLVIDDGFSL